MADSATAVLENSRKGVFPLRFSSGTTFLRNTTVSGGTERQTGSRSTGGATPHYLTMPDLGSAQEIIQASAKSEIPCRLLARLESAFSDHTVPERSDNLQTVLSTAFHAWVESFMSKRVLARFDLTFQDSVGKRNRR